MALNINNHDAIFPVKTVSGNTESTDTKPEAAGQQYKRGIPLQINAGGNLQQWDGTTVTAGIAGVSLHIGSNLGSAGQGAPAPGYGGITGTKATQTYGSVQNEILAVNIAIGAPATDGRALYALANFDTLFKIMVDNTSGAVPADYTPTLLNMVDKFYGITFDSNGQAFLDASKSTKGTNTVFQVKEYSTIDGNQVNGHVHGFFQLAAQQLNG